MRHFLTAIALPLAAAIGIFASAPVAATGEHAGGPSFVLIPADQNSATMSGTLEDYRHAKAIRAGKEGLLYMRRDGAAYVIRDPALLSRAMEIFAPERALGAQQEALGSRQEVLGTQQEALGAQQERLGRRQENASPRLAAALARDQDALGQQQSALGEKQGVLGREQEALGRQQEQASRVAKGKLGVLFDAAMRDGKAQRVRN